jgi:outer membrane protein assembly factor BamD
MIFKQSWQWLVFFIILLILASCGGKVKKENLNADQYFEYAKKKFDRGKYLDAITEFTVITLKFSGNPIVDDAQFYLAESHFKNNEFLIAVAEYQKVINDYPESAYVQECFYKIGLSFYQLSQRPELDQEYTLKALRQLQIFIEAYPDGDLRVEADLRLMELRTKMARKQLLGGNVYRKMGIYDSAVIYYNILLEKYYDTPPAEPAMYWKGICLIKLREYEEALTNFTAFVEKYPKSRYAKDAKSKISDIQEKINN